MRLNASAPTFTSDTEIRRRSPSGIPTILSALDWGLVIKRDILSFGGQWKPHNVTRTGSASKSLAQAQ